MRLSVHALACLLSVLGTSATIAAPPPASEQRTVPVTEPLAYGTAWYPEQWSESEWDADLKLMKQGGFTFVRLGEFAWSSIEPAEGKYDWGWLDRAIAKASAYRLKVVIGTPTAAPPAWMTEKYPEILLVEQTGIRSRHGGRRHFSVGSALYRQKAAKIAELMAARYGSNPAVIGFQIDNEYGRATYDDEIRARFQVWLKAKYQTLGAFNAAYDGAQWSLAYSDWKQVPIPDARDNPSLYLDWMRFFSMQWRDYQQVQMDAIRPHLPRPKFITTNYTGRYDNFDAALTAQPLDLVSWDWYFPGVRVDPAEGGFLNDMNRGFIEKNFWVMETAPGNTNWADRNYVMPRGEVRAMAWQAVAHGADGYAFWTWRPALGGVEQFHGTLTDAGGRPQPVFAEAAQVGAEFAKVRAAIAGTDPVVDTAMLHDFPNRWAIKRQPMTVDYDPFVLFTDFYRATKPAVAGIAVVAPTTALKRYKLVVAPALHLVSLDEAKALGDYVRQGGHLVIGPRAGVKDHGSKLLMPGPLAAFSDLVGAHVDQTHVPPEPLALSGELGTATVKIWAERIAIDKPDVSTLLRYPASDDWLDRAPAVITRKVGKGRVTYIGAWLDDGGFKRVMSWAARMAGTKPVFPDMPDDVEITARDNGSNRLVTAINWGRTAKTITLPSAQLDLLTGAQATSVTLQPYGVAVLRRP